MSGEAKPFWREMRPLGAWAVVGTVMVTVLGGRELVTVTVLGGPLEVTVTVIRAVGGHVLVTVTRFIGADAVTTGAVTVSRAAETPMAAAHTPATAAAVARNDRVDRDRLAMVRPLSQRHRCRETRIPAGRAALPRCRTYLHRVGVTRSPIWTTHTSE